MLGTVTPRALGSFGRGKSRQLSRSGRSSGHARGLSPGPGPGDERDLDDYQFLGTSREPTSTYIERELPARSVRVMSE